MKLLADLARRRRERVDAYQQELVDRGVMCPACRHLSVSVGLLGDRASQTAGQCGAPVDVGGWGGDTLCDCRNLWHGH